MVLRSNLISLVEISRFIGGGKIKNSNIGSSFHVIEK